MKTILQVFLFCLPIIGFTQEVSTYPEEIFTEFYKFQIRGDHVIAIGSCDQIWTSKDLGKTWATFQADDYLYDVAFLPGSSTQVIVQAFRQVFLYDFDQGIILDFTDDLREIDGTSNWYVECTNDKVLLLAHDGIRSATVGEYEWEHIFVDTLPSTPSGKAQTENFIFYGTRDGRMFKYSKNDGSVEVLPDIENGVSDMTMVNDQIGYMMKNNTGGIIKTTDGWISSETMEGMPEGRNPVAYGEDVLLSVNVNRLFRSMDGGKTSTRIDTDMGVEYSEITEVLFTDDGTLYAVGSGAMFMKSEDFGLTFEHVNPIDRNNFYDGAITNGGVGYMVGDNNTIVKTEDHGTTWSKMSNPGSGSEHNLSLVEIMNDGTIFVGGNEYYQLLDGEQEVYKAEEELLASIYNEESDYIIAVRRDGNNDFKVLKSFDKGRTWEVKHNIVNSAYFISQSPTGSIYVPVQDGIVAVSDDEGETWTEVQMASDWIREVQFLDESIGLIHVGRKVLKTLDGGDSFEEIADIYGISDIQIVGENHYYFTPGYNDETNLMETTDGGETFKNIFMNCAGTTKMMTNTRNQVIVGHKYGHINVVDLATPVSTNETILKDQSIVYPNPIKTGMELTFGEEWESLEIFSLQGLKVLSLNTYQKSILMAELNAGVYILKTKTGDNSKIAKLMIVD